MVNAESAKGEKRGGSRGHIARHILFLQCSREVVGAMTDPLLTLVAERIVAALGTEAGVLFSTRIGNVAAQAALSVIREQEGWRPIEEFSEREGKALIFDERWGVTEARRFDGARWGIATFNGQIIAAHPTHFRPLPAPPLEKM